MHLESTYHVAAQAGSDQDIRNKRLLRWSIWRREGAGSAILIDTSLRDIREWRTCLRARILVGGNAVGVVRDDA
jgi:hypothetical protein